MNKIEKQILKNQQSILNSLNYIMMVTTRNSGDLRRQIVTTYDETTKLLSEKDG